MPYLHILLDPFNDFWKCPKNKKRFNFFILFWQFFLSDPQTHFKYINFGMVVNWHKYFFCIYTIFSELKLKSDFDKTIDQSNVFN